MVGILRSFFIEAGSDSRIDEYQEQRLPATCVLLRAAARTPLH